MTEPEVEPSEFEKTKERALKALEAIEAERVRAFGALKELEAHQTIACTLLADLEDIYRESESEREAAEEKAEEAEENAEEAEESTGDALNLLFSTPDGRRLIERAFLADSRKTATELNYLGAHAITGELEVGAALARRALAPSVPPSVTPTVTATVTATRPPEAPTLRRTPRA